VHREGVRNGEQIDRYLLYASGADADATPPVPKSLFIQASPQDRCRSAHARFNQVTNDTNDRFDKACTAFQ